MKNFLKKHKWELITGGVGLLAITAICVFTPKSPYELRCVYAMPKSTNANVIFSPNTLMDTVDMFVKAGEEQTHLWAFDVGEAQALCGDLALAIEILRPQG